uniref:Uncharacterized protein n=1 Tax=Aegilops tauschii TaxID=37682 RepID=M8BXN8_AEGTA
METRPVQLSARPTDMKMAVRERMRQQQPGLPTWRRSRRSYRGADGREGREPWSRGGSSRAFPHGNEAGGALGD